MGGPGSGRYAYNVRKTTDDLPSLDVRTLRRERDIVRGQEELVVRTQPPHTVGILWEPSGFSGASGFPRPWFDCPGGCGRRVAILYLETSSAPGGANRLLCRTCLDLAYRSQREDHIGRAKRRAEKKLARIVAPGEDLSGKPKGMHNRTMVRLGSEYVRAHQEHVELYNEKAARQATRRPSRSSEERDPRCILFLTASVEIPSSWAADCTSSHRPAMLPPSSRLRPLGGILAGADAPRLVVGWTPLRLVWCR